MSRLTLNRRRFLAGLTAGAGATLLTPFLRQALAGGPLPSRFVIVVEGNCIEPVTMMSTSARTAIDAQATGSTIDRRWFPDRYGHSTPLNIPAGDLGTAHALSPLLPGTTGIDLTTKAAVVLGLSSTITGGGHSTHFGALSCSRSRPGRPAGQTIDAWLAEQPGVRGNTPFDAVRVGVDSSNGKLANNTCAFEVAKSAPVTLDPVLAYNNLFGFIPGSSGEVSFTRRTDLLDFAMLDVNAKLTSFPGNSAERAKLEQYLASLETIRQRQVDLSAIAANIDPNDPTTAFPAPEDPSTNPLYATGDHFDVLEAQFENVTSALLGGLTNVAVITSGTGDSGFGRMNYARIFQNYGSIDNGLERHDLHHGSSSSPDFVSAIHDVSREHVSLIGNLARALEAVPEGNGTMLDQTAILYLPDNGEQHHSTASEWPCLLVGGSGLGLLTDGRTVVFPGVDDVNNRQVSNLFNTLAYAAGVPMDDFGEEGETRIATGPLSEIYT